MRKSFMGVLTGLAYVFYWIVAYQQTFAVVSAASKFYASKFRYARFGNVDSCGKRKRNIENRKCFRQCSSDADCRGNKRRCLCDGECGLSCVRITTSCTKIGDFKDGTVSYNPDNYFGSLLSYECNSGYTLVGNKMRVCEGDGWWSGSSPVCTKEVYCDYPPKVANAIPNVEVNNEARYKVGTEVEYQCDIGYISANHSNKISCEESGKWSELQIKCTRINCGQPEEIENGSLRANDYTYSSVVEYKCAPGFRIHGDNLRECELSGKWSGHKPRCEPIDCGEPPSHKHASASFNTTRFPARALYSCLSDQFYMDGPAEIRCLPSGRWSDYHSRCIMKNCTLNPGEYSKKAYNIFSSMAPIAELIYPGSSVLRISCHPGFELNGADHVTCVTHKTSTAWSNTLPICKPEKYCPLINPPPNGLISVNQKSAPAGYLTNTSLEFSCLPGFRLKGGSAILVCEKGGKWKGEQPICMAETTTTSTITSTTTTTTSTTTTLTTTTSTTTSTTTTTKPTAATRPSTTTIEFSIKKFNQESCKIDTASTLISYSSANYGDFQSSAEFVFVNASVGSFIEDSATVSYYCKNNEYVNYLAKCLNGTLIMQHICHDSIQSNAYCHQPPKIPNGYNKFSSFLPGSKVIYQCFTGFELSQGDRELVCADGKWSGNVPICTKINCGFPGFLPNGKILYVGTLAEYTYQPYMTMVGQNKQIRYDCDKGFKLTGPTGSTCINGNWKPSFGLVKCIKDPNLREPPSIESQIVELKAKHSPRSDEESSSLLRDKEPEFSEVATYARLENNNNNLIKTKKSRRKLKRLKKHKVKANSTSESDLKRGKRKKTNARLNTTADTIIS